MTKKIPLVCCKYTDRNFKKYQYYQGKYYDYSIKSFKNVNDLEVTLTTVLPPNKLDFKEYRRGKNAGLEGEDAKVDGVMFAATDFDAADVVHEPAHSLFPHAFQFRGQSSLRIALVLQLG